VPPDYLLKLRIDNTVTPAGNQQKFFRRRAQIASRISRRVGA
jgi:hypothetical protein